MVLSKVKTWVLSKLDKEKIGLLILESTINFIVSTCFALATSYYLWLIYFRPHYLHPRIGSAVLVTFDLLSPPAAAATGGGNNKELLYDLTINMTFINKSSLTNVHFDHVITGLYYSGTKVGPSDYSVPTFKLKQERSRMVPLSLRGRATNVSAVVAEGFEKERAEGLFNLNVKVKTMLTYKFFPHRMTYYYEFDCWLQFPPVPGNGMPAVTGGFKCGVAK